MVRTFSITMPSKVGIVGRAARADCRRKSVMFFVSLFFVTLWNYEVCDNGNAMKECNFHNNYDTVTQRKVSSCASVFKFFYEPSEFSLMGKFFYQKLAFLAILGANFPQNSKFSRFRA